MFVDCYGDDESCFPFGAPRLRDWFTLFVALWILADMNNYAGLILGWRMDLVGLTCNTQQTIHQSIANIYIQNIQ